MADSHSIPENTAGNPVWLGRERQVEDAAYRKLGWTKKLRKLKRNGRDRKNLFNTVARELGKKFGATISGYDLLVEFTGFTGESVVASPITERLRQSGQKKKRKKSRAIGALVNGVDVRSDEFLSSYEWRRLRMVVIKKRSPRCECCGATPADGHTVINVDHIKPRRLHPELALEESNLQVLCHVCNHGKGNWDDTDWRDWQPPEMYEPFWSRKVN